MNLPIAALYAAIFLVLDSIVSFYPSWRSTIVSDFFRVLAPAIALVACSWRARRAPARARILWILLRTSLLLWICGAALSIWEDWIHLSFDTPSASDFAFFYYGIPVLFAISTPVDGPRIHWFLWLDALQAAFAGYLAYAAIFSSLPFAAHPLSASLIASVFNIENLVLAVACAFRMFTSQRWSDEWRFFRMLGIFLIVYGIGIGLYNHYALLLAQHTPPNVLATAPFIVLAVHALTLPWTRRPEDEKEHRRTRAELFIDNASPIFFSLALLTLGLIALRINLLAGIVAISLSLIVYAIRTTVLQTRYLEVQGELQEARDRLEAISLEDALTGVANRRHFDQALAQEWRRAARTHNSLALIFADIDLFKELNDSQGHQAGDRSLVQVAGILHGLTKRSGDLVARYGGEEFATILAGATEDEALAMAERMRLAIQALHISNATAIGPWLTASIGVAACVPSTDCLPATLLAAADKALYRAKALGRNRVEVESRSTPPGVIGYSI
ncbi:MAG TPA: GGDEF domain-containing protein [Acidobacteriaceae bacterium]|nr:GGDEF domain-containing protein [Acidobacteriaceae bacterium]